MDLDPRSQGALRGALEQLLRPLCRLLLRHSVSFSAFADIAKRVYVDVALKDFSLPGKKPTTSRVAVLIEGRWAIDEPRSGELNAFVSRYGMLTGA